MSKIKDSAIRMKVSRHDLAGLHFRAQQARDAGQSVLVGPDMLEAVVALALKELVKSTAQSITKSRARIAKGEA